MISEKVQSIKDKFGFVDDFKTMFSSIKNYLFTKGEQIPIISINLGNAEGKYNYGNTAYALDMTWYSRYKPLIDNIIIAFAYISFIFLVFKRLPDIISGAGAITKNVDNISNYKGDD